MSKIIGEAIPNMPWQERPEGCDDVVWRYDKNPIITRKNVRRARSIFNSAVVPFEGKFVGVFRVDDKSLKQGLHVGRSDDGLNWDIEDEPIKFISEDKETGDFVRGFDPRVVYIEDRYYVTWANIIEGEGGTPGIAYTFDFKTFYQLPNIFPLYNRNAVLFPRKINGKFGLLNRPSARGHCPFGSIYYAESPDMEYWGKHRIVMRPTGGWQELKIGAGPIPIETDEGWIMIYHGVIQLAAGMIYSVGAAILDKDEPWKVLYRTKDMIMGPEEYYERVGDVDNVLFPCATLADSATGRIAMYYGAADTVVGVAFTTVDELIKYIKENSY